MAKIQAMKSELEQCKKKLVKEKERRSKWLEENE